jgi:phage tail-like protein
VPSANDDQLYIANSFALEIDSVALARFTEVSGLENESEVREVTQSTKDGKVIIIKSLGATTQKPGKVTLKTKSKAGAEALWKWRQEVIDGKMANARRNGSIIIYDSEAKELARWNFLNGWPSKMSLGSLSATSNDPVDIEITIDHEGIAPAK